jgi:hypothetical protein
MDQQKQQIVEKLQAANNILVTVSNSPSVDQLAACIGLTLALNKLGKHATAVFSGQVPNTIDFLKPQDTLEKDTNSLRDFIIALDKSKADKLRYKVEDKVVKIFITPYRTSLSGDDLEFSQGDFNVDVVLALGVKQQVDLDEAITAHGRILHDATVMCLNTTENGDLGSVNWLNHDSSSLSEMATELTTALDKSLLDAQISTAFMTGIVAETDRFRNERTSASTMSMSATLMKAGANQQLVASELDHEMSLQSGTAPKHDKPASQQASSPAEKAKSSDGALEISHEEPKQPTDEPSAGGKPELPAVDIDDSVFDFSSNEPDSHIDKPVESTPPADDHRALVTEPPTFGSRLTANDEPEDTGATNINMLPNDPAGVTGPTMTRASEPVFEPLPPSVPDPAPPQPIAPPEQPTPVMPPAPVAAPQQPSESVTPTQPPLPPSPAPWTPPTGQSQHQETLTELEESIGSPHTDSVDDVQKARDEVMRALSEQPEGSLPPIEALNAQPIDLNPAPAPVAQPNSTPPAPLPPNPQEAAPFSNSPADRPLDMPLPSNMTMPPAQAVPPTNAPQNAPDAPPPVPPPFMPGSPQR